MSKVLVLKNEVTPVGVGAAANSGLSDLFSTGIGYLTGEQVRRRADKLDLTEPERENFSTAQKRARILANLYGVGRGLEYLGRGYLRGRPRPIESIMQGAQSAQMAGVTAEPFFTRRALSNIEASREGQEGQEDEFGRVAVKPPVEEMLRPQTPAETRHFKGLGVRELPKRGESLVDELLQYYPSSRPVVEEKQMTFSPEITGGLPSLSQPTVQPTPTMTSKEVGVLSQRPTANLAEPTVTPQQMRTLLDEYDKSNFQDKRDKAQGNQPDLTGGASGSTIMGG